jgi:diadenylate cyclase
MAEFDKMNSNSLMPFATITVGEIVDVLLVAILIYTAIVWVRRTRAAFVVRGMSVFGAAYLVVRYLDLQTTAWIFQAFFAMFVVMIVVIFQEELRQMFERVAVWSFTAGGKRDFHDQRRSDSGAVRLARIASARSW